MHNLRRVAAGLRGEYLEPEATPEPEEGNSAGADAVLSKKGAKAKGKRAQGEWQDAETVALQEDGLVVGDVGQRTNGVVEGWEEPEVQATYGDGDEGGSKRKQEDGAMTKEQRKKAKKEREHKRKQDNERQRASKAD